MADIERIAPLVPTLPAPVDRRVGSRRKRPPGAERAPRSEHNVDPPPRDPTNPNSPNDHIDEYV